MTNPPNGQCVCTRLFEPTTIPVSETARLVQSQLQRSSYSALHNVVCDVRGGVLRLSGRLPCHYLKQVAVQIASELAGEFSVLNDIRVVSVHQLTTAAPSDGEDPANVRDRLFASIKC